MVRALSIVLRIWGLIRSFAQAQSGNVSIIGLGIFLVLAAMFSVALDVGVLYTTKRDLQTVADLAVLKAVTDPNEAEALVADVVAQNGLSGALSEAPGVTRGQFPPAGYTMDTVTGLPIDSRFEAGVADGNALQVSLSESPRLYLVQLFFDPTARVRAQATAANLPFTQLAIRSSALSFDSDKATAFNGLLSSLLGTSVNLSAVGYDGLLSADIKLIDFLDALAAAVGVSAGDYDAVLQEDVTFPEIVTAALNAIGADPDFSGDVAAATGALQQIVNDLGTIGPFPLADIMSVEAERPQNAAAARLNLLDLFLASSEAANAEHSSTAEVSVPILGGLVSMRAAVVEPPRFSAIGGVGISVETAQMRLFLEVEPTQALSLLGTSFDIRIPVLIETAKGEATVTDLSCPTPLPADASVSVAATSTLVQTSVIDIDPAAIGGATTPVGQVPEIVGAGSLLTVTATGEVDYGATTSNMLFVAPFDENNYQTVATSDPVAGAAASLFGGLTYDVEALGIPLITQAMVVDALSPIVDAVAPGVDALLDDTLEAFGVGIGNVDVGVPYIRCSNPMLIL